MRQDDRNDHVATGRLDVVGIGFAILDRIYVDGRRTRETLGGTCGNVVANLAQLGHRAGAMLRLGDDRAGATMRADFRVAGADVDLIEIDASISSPIIAQIEASSGGHGFTFICPETGASYPRAVGVRPEAVARAASTLRNARALFCDRLSSTCLAAMTAAADGGAVVVFEPDPDSITDRELLRRALALCDVAKFSEEKFPKLTDEERHLKEGGVTIVTRGERGLSILRNGDATDLPVIPASTFVDASGAGDCVTTGAIDAVVTTAMRHGALDAAALVEGIVAGQRLAAANCGRSGARGLFLERTGAELRDIVTGR